MWAEASSTSLRRNHALPPLLLAALLLASACAILPPRGQHGLRDVSFRLRSMRLRSGLRVVVEEDRRSPVVGIINVVGAGASADPAGPSSAR